MNNKRLAAAAAAHASAEEHPELPEALERTQAAVDAAVSRREKILASQGGGATGVGTRMGP